MISNILQVYIQCVLIASTSEWEFIIYWIKLVNIHASYVQVHRVSRLAAIELRECMTLACLDEIILTCKIDTGFDFILQHIIDGNNVI